MTAPAIADLADMVLQGERVTGDLRDAITKATYQSTIDGPLTVALQLRDPHGAFVESQVFNQRSTLTVEDRTFVLARNRVRAAGPSAQLTVEFDDEISVALRSKTGYLPAAGGTVTRDQFIQLLGRDANVATDVEGNTEAVKVALARGSDRPDAKPESSWDAGRRMAREVAVRSFSDGTAWLFGSDDWLQARQVSIDVAATDPAITSLDWDVDAGLPVDKLSFTARASRFSLLAGQPITVIGQGPAAGAVWLASRVRGNLLGSGTDVECTREAQRLPEPDAPAHEPGDGLLAGLVGGAATSGVPGSATGRVEQMVQFALSKSGGPYVWGGNGPRGYDCSGLTHAAAKHVGAALVRQSMGALDQCRNARTTISVADGIATRGALLFRARPIDGITHIALSLGNGRTIEARGRSAGIGSFSAAGRFDNAALVPGIAYR